MRAQLFRFLLKRNKQLRNQKIAERKALSVFQKNIETGWYSLFINETKCNVRKIKTVLDFKYKVPLLTKQSVFEKNNFRQLVNCTNHQIHSIMLSSGHSNSFSLGIITRSDYRKLASQTDLFLDIFFGIKKREALIINASSMGVRAFTKHTCCDTGPRSDIVVALLRQVSPQYKKTVVSADPHLIKQIVEEANDAGVDWSKLNLWFISGGEWFPETLRNYVHCLTGKSADVPEKGFWAAIYGLTELGYPILFETAQLVVNRSNLASTKTLGSDCFSYKQGRSTTPFLFHYFQSAFYVEQVGDERGVPELVFTTLDRKRAISLIRYNTHDVGELLNETSFSNLKYSLPVVAFWGRNQNELQLPTTKVILTDIKELLFVSFDLASKITGYFTLKQEDAKAILIVQLKKRAILSLEDEAQFLDLMHQVYHLEIEVAFNGYFDFEQQMELDFERKFKHLIEKHHG